jgi:hypothetical protein
MTRFGIRVTTEKAEANSGQESPGHGEAHTSTRLQTSNTTLLLCNLLRTLSLLSSRLTMASPKTIKSRYNNLAEERGTVHQRKRQGDDGHQPRGEVERAREDDS